MMRFLFAVIELEIKRKSIPHRYWSWMAVEMGTWLASKTRVHPWSLFCILSAHAYPGPHTHTKHTHKNMAVAQNGVVVINYVYATLQEIQESADSKPKTRNPETHSQMNAASATRQPIGNGNGTGNGHVNDNGHVNWFGPSGWIPSRWYTRQISTSVRRFIVILIPGRLQFSPRGLRLIAKGW